MLAEKIRAVDADDVAERVLNTHFIRDLMGNLSAFSKQKFRCTKCNTSYRRMPLAGKCTKFKGKGICNGNIIPTVHEGSVKKYLEMSREMVKKYKVSEYTINGSKCSILPSSPRSGRRNRSSWASRISCDLFVGVGVSENQGYRLFSPSPIRSIILCRVFANIISTGARVSKPGQRRQTQDLFLKKFAGSNPSPRIPADAG